MAYETAAILRKLFYQALKAKDKAEIIKAMKAMIDPADVALVEKQIADD